MTVPVTPAKRTKRVPASTRFLLVPDDKGRGGDTPATAEACIIPEKKGVWSLRELQHAGEWYALVAPFAQRSDPRADLTAVPANILLVVTTWRDVPA